MGRHGLLGHMHTTLVEPGERDGPYTRRAEVDSSLKQRCITGDSGVCSRFELNSKKHANGGLWETVHGLEDPERRAWLGWRLAPVEHEHCCLADVGVCLLRLQSQGGETALSNAIVAAKAALAEAQALVEVPLQGQKAPTAVEPLRLAWVSARALAQQYGLRLCESGVQHLAVSGLPCILGPAEPAHDAAELLLEQLVRGHKTAVVLHTSGQVQGLPERMARDFEADLRSLEAECNVKVRRCATLLSVSSENAEAVGRARQLLQDVLSFYLPAECVLLKGLNVQVIHQLHHDARLRVLTAAGDCVVDLDDEAGTVWICGKRCSAADRLIKSVEEGRKQRGPAVSEPAADSTDEAAVGAGQGVAAGAGGHQDGDHRGASVPTAVAPLGRMQHVRGTKQAQPLPREALLLAAGGSALPVELDLLWPAGTFRELSWERLETFWGGLEERFSTQLN